MNSVCGHITALAKESTFAYLAYPITQSPEEFEEYQIVGKKLGFVSIMSGSLIRGSFHATEMHISATRE